MARKKLYLLDAFALIFRGYYAFIKNPRINSKGMDTSAILGFTNSLFEVIRKEKPDLLAVAFDKGGSSARTEAFPEYKANRQETPEAIKIAVPYIHQLLEAMNIPIVEVAGIEADDLIGTLAKQAEKEDYDVYMVTPDKDYAQLVSEHIFMYRPARMGNGIEIWGVEQVKEKFEVEDPLQVIDYLGMMGDAVDNIPGLPGVGDKTAKKFIKAYGSMEGLLEHTHELKGKMKEKVEANKELGLLSKELATIMLDCPVEFHAENYKLTPPDMEATQALFQELEFRRLNETLKKMFATTEEEQVNSPISSNQNDQLDLFSAGSGSQVEKVEKEHLYQHITSPTGLKILVEKIRMKKSLVVDVSFNEVNVMSAALEGIAISIRSGAGYFIPLKEENLAEFSLIKDVLEDPDIALIGHDLKEQIKVLARYGIQVEGNLFDTMIAHYLINPDLRHSLDLLADTYLGVKMMNLDEILGRGKKRGLMNDMSLETRKEYSSQRADIIGRLATQFKQELGSEHLSKLFYDIEMPLLQVLAKMELEGIKLDVPYITSLAKDLETDIANLERQIFELAGETFNIASPKQLGIVLFEHMNLVEKPKKTKTGQYATSEDILSALASEHAIVALILEYRGLVKLKNTYVDALPNEVNEKTARVHTTYSQAVAATGRLSSNNPNLQNIPIRTERGKLVRKAFVAKDENYTLMAADYSQIELRLIADMSGDPALVEAFNQGEDIHKATAAKVFNVALEEVTREQRSQAKTVNFGIIYGVSAHGLSQQTNLSRKESKALIDTYYATYPSLKAYMDKQINVAREQGYVETLMGRRRYLKNINSRNAIVRGADERNAINAPIQGSAADIIKLAMIRIQNYLEEKQTQSRMLLQVHDELVFDLHKSEAELLKPVIQNFMETAFKLQIPLSVDMDEGDNWLDAH
ncbi:DNA polymerase I [Flavobacteriaceae bacterium]|nr:DNA polymerase I [Flavobacteriaceae bacterium]